MAGRSSSRGGSSSGSSFSGRRRVLVSSSNCSMTLRFLGCFWFCLRLLSLSGLQSLTQLRRMPIFSWSLLGKSKLQNQPRRSWQQQSSRLFLEMPTSLAASCRFSLRFSDLCPCRCRSRHRFTSSITSAIVRSRLRPSLPSLPSRPSRPSRLSGSRLESGPSESGAYSNLRLQRMRMTRGSRYCLCRNPFWAPSLSREAKRLALGSQMETLWWWRGQQMESRQLRLMKFWRRSSSYSTRIDCCVSSFSNTNVLNPFYGFIIVPASILIFLIRNTILSTPTTHTPSEMHSFEGTRHFVGTPIPIDRFLSGRETMLQMQGLKDVFNFAAFWGKTDGIRDAWGMGMIIITLDFISMLKFRALKDNIVCSKRLSQKLSEQELLSCTEDHLRDHSLSRLNTDLASKLTAQLQQITHHHYKLRPASPQRHPHTQHHPLKDQPPHQPPHQHQRTRTECVQPPPQPLDTQLTAKKPTHLSRSVVEGNNFNTIVTLLQQIIDLKKRRPREGLEDKREKLAEEMRQKLGAVRVLLRSFEEDSQRSLIDFYGEEQACSPDSFHSQSSDDTYQPQSDREAYEFSDHKQHVHTGSTDDHEEQEIRYRRLSPHEEPQEIRYRRLSPSHARSPARSPAHSPQHQSIFEMFQEQGEGECEVEREGSPSCGSFEEEREGDRSIVHLFSYTKENGLDTPLSRITEREEEYLSPESRGSRKASLAASLEYKKIYYLLETSGKKEEQTYRGQVSEFTPSQQRSSARSSNKDRSRCHEQLGEMISLLQNKYQRKVKIGVENLMDSLNLALKHNAIRLRNR